MGMIQIIDVESQPNAPSSKFISREEFRKLFPDRMNRKLSFIFKYNAPITVESPVGEQLIKKYQSIKRYDIASNESDDDIADMKRPGLIKIAIQECGANSREVMKLKKVEVLDLIRKARVKRAVIAQDEG